MTIQQVVQTINADFTWEGQHYPVYEGRPASNKLTALCWADVSSVTGPRTLRITNRSGKIHIITVKDHTLHVIECLMRRPIKSASIPRIGEYVRVLRHDHDVEIHCERYQGNAYGIYRLIAKVDRIKVEVKA